MMSLKTILDATHYNKRTLSKTMDNTLSLKSNLDHTVYRLINKLSEDQFNDKNVLQMAIHAEILLFARMARAEGISDIIDKIMDIFPSCKTTRDISSVYVQENYE